MANEGFFPKSDGDIHYASDFNRVNLAMATANWTTAFATTSVSYVDVTDATITLSGLDSSETYDLFAIVSTNNTQTAAATEVIALLIDGTIVNEISANQAGGQYPLSLNGIKQSVTGATSYTAKLQVKTETSTVTINVSNAKSCITLIAFPK